MQPSKIHAGDKELLGDFQKLNCNEVADGKSGVESTAPSTECSARVNSGQNAGVAACSPWATPPPPPPPHAQTAPAVSPNYYGFNYPYNYQYSNSLLFGNNNSMFPPTTTLPDQNPLYCQLSQSGCIRSNSSHPDVSNVASNTGGGDSAKCSTGKEDRSCTSANAMHPPIPPRPVGYTGNVMQGSPGSCVYMPQVFGLNPVLRVPNSSGLHTSPTNTYVNASTAHAENPELLSTNSQLVSAHSPVNVSPGVVRKDYNSQLHVNIDASDTSVHDWRPVQMYSPPSQPMVPPLPFQMGPGYAGHPLNMPPMYQPENSTSEQTPANLHMSPVYLPMAAYSPMAFPPGVYYHVPNSSQILIPSFDVQKHVSQQRQYLNSLKYELVRSQVDIASLKEEIAMLEQSLKDNPSVPQKDEIEDLNAEISKLRMECYCLCTEVDEQYKGRVPLGEINEDFYSCINTGQQGPLRSGLIHSKQTKQKGNSKSQKQEQLALEDDEDKETNRWTCSKCTFQNHPAISVCEMCQVGQNLACS